MFSTLYPLLICQSGCNIIAVDYSRKSCKKQTLPEKYREKPKVKRGCKNKNTRGIRISGTYRYVKHSSTLRQINTNPHNKGQFILFLVNTCSAFNKNITKHVEKQDKTVWRDKAIIGIRLRHDPDDENKR